jgi:hypothetical protein
MLKWKHLPWNKDQSPRSQKVALRLNALADPYFLGKVILGQTRIVQHLHGKWLDRLSDPNLHLVLESPRDHMKTTCGTFILPIWWALPFENREEDWMRELGYGDEWIRYMKRIHSRNLRILIAVETEPNAVKIGYRFDTAYEKNALFREVFSDLIPKPGAVWNQLIKTHNRTGQSSGEGTFNFIGVGTALQSNHMDRAIEDDLFGENAQYSQSERERTIEWHQKLPGAFDTDTSSETGMNLELVIGNRWCIGDLNDHIRRNDPLFKFETHSAEGGCCPDHPAGEPIFPEEFSMERLQALRVRFGARFYSSHYLNNPISEETCDFRKDWLRRYRPYIKEVGFKSDGTALKQTWIEVLPRGKDDIVEDFRVADLERVLILDPNHGGERGRARHAAIVAGWRKRNGIKEVYLLDCWAKAVSHETMKGQVAAMAARWRVQKFLVEVVAGQDGWLAYFDRTLPEKSPGCIVSGLPKERSAGAKERRILSMSPYYERGQVFVPVRGAEAFIEEYEYYPNGTTVDLLDCMGYLFSVVETQSVDAGAWKYQAEREMERRRRSIGRAGY